MSPSHGPSNSLEQLLLQSLQHLLIALQLNQAPPLSNLPQRTHSLHKPRRVGLWRCFWYPLGFDTPRPLYLRIRSSLTLGRIQHFCFQVKIAGRRRPRAWSYQSRTRIIRDCSHTRDPHRAPLLSLCPRQHYTRMTLSTTTSGLVVHLSPIASFSSAARSTSVVSLFCINHLHLCTHTHETTPKPQPLHRKLFQPSCSRKPATNTLHWISLGAFPLPSRLSLFQDFETHTVAKQTRARCPSHRIVAVQRAPGVLTSIGTGKATRIFAIHTEKISGRLSPSLTASLTMKHYNPPLDIRLTPALQPSLWLFRERWTFCAKGNAPCVDPTSPIFIFLCRLEYETHSYSNLQKNSKIHGHDGRCGSCGRDATCCLQHMWDM
jgi:hypothetical protein